MDRDLIIGRCQRELNGFLGWMLACLGALGGLSGDRQRRMHLGVLRMVRAVEAGVRRLVSVEASGLVLPGRAGRAMQVRVVRGASAPVPPFRLLDPRKNFGRKAGAMPRVTVIGVDDRPLVAVRALNVEVLARRLEALRAALDDLPAQARRLARWRARQEMRIAAGKKAVLLSPMRPGWPPGYRARGQGALGEVLLECDRLARRVENERFAAGMASA